MSQAPELPFVDEHSQPFDAPPGAVWSALLRTFRRRSRATGRLARVLGCDPSESTPLFTGRPGQTVPGFRVVEAEPGRRLTLSGRHRFAAYALTFVVGGGHLRVQTHAAFPGAVGSLYRTAVIGSGGHGLVTRYLLKHVAQRASRQHLG